ncbi:protein UL34 [Panine betaherpesvirus 2]|uniref:Protein UL34 n=1 Tax=Panine betaherpesvirus 2 TaxID=188763 RepID=Q8QS54_9BETA|nr:protein UL34 [Panine betaherpesvirus 2]AAM00685.1 protein UL34 [Panine betaherpesvirus 2]QXV67788.1 protein UL34 [Panine betaherpesvirus 2]
MEFIITTRDFSNDDSVLRAAEMRDNVAGTISKAYKGTVRAEGKKKLLLKHLPVQPGGCTRRNGNLFVFCTDRDYRKFHQGIAQLKRAPVDLEPSEIQQVTSNIRCRLQPSERDPPAPTDDLQTAVSRVCTLFNQLVFTAQLRHYCEHQEKIVAYARDELTKRCGERSALGVEVHALVALLPHERHRDLCNVLIGLLHQTPHMWARSIRLIAILRHYLQNSLLNLLVSSGLDISQVFDACYQSEAYRILFQIGNSDSPAPSPSYCVPDEEAAAALELSQRASAAAVLAAAANIRQRLPPPLPSSRPPAPRRRRRVKHRSSGGDEDDERDDNEDEEEAAAAAGEQRGGEEEQQQEETTTTTPTPLCI